MKVGNAGSSPAARDSDKTIGISQLEWEKQNDLNLRNFLARFDHFFILLRMDPGLSPPPRSLLAICCEYQTSDLPGFSLFSAR